MTEVVVVIGPGQIGQAIARRVGFGKHVRFVPIADIVLIRHFIGARQANGWSRFAICCPAAPHPR